MLKKDTIHAYANGEVKPQETAQRSEKLLGSNCVSVEILSFFENGRVVRVILKKSRIGSDRLEEVREEYRKLRHYFGDIIPLQAFITEKPSNGRELISAFCSPVTIAYDVFASDENFEFLRREARDNHDLQNDIDLFISGYKSLERIGFIVDLFGDENLVVTREGRLKYIDSFIIDMSGRKSLRPISEGRFQKLKALGTLK